MPEEKEQTQSLSEFPLATVLPAGARENLELALNNGIYALRTFLLSHRHPAIQREQVVNFAYPKTWWQMVKFQYFPPWLKRAFPIEMAVVEKKVTWMDGPLLLCPHTSREPKEKHLQFLATGVYNASPDKVSNS